MKIDPSLDVLYLGSEAQFLDNFFHPKTVAVIGASEKEGSVGWTLVWNLLKTPFGGTIFPVNPKRSSILGMKAYPSVSSIGTKIDLAVIATPAATVPAIIDECIKCDVKAAVIISAGFKERGKEGEELEESILERIKGSKLRIIGPNCLGVMNPMSGLNATFAASSALKGNIAFISQSGALCTAVLDWSLKEGVGFSSFVSIGAMIDVDWGDLIKYFGSDPNTQSILIYMESIGNPRSFLSAAREIALTKPIILIKAGRTEESAKAAASHTGSLAGSDDVFNAALKRVGVLRVDSIADLFSMAEILSKQPRPRGPNLTIITNAGGPGVIATDALIENGGKLATLSPETKKQLDAVLPPFWSHGNPIDILGDADAERYAETLKIVADDPNSDGVLVILTPQYMTDPEKTAQKLKDFAVLDEKPIFASWMGGERTDKGNKILSGFGIPVFSYPDLACRAFGYMWSYSYNLKGLYETPILKEMEESNQIQRQKEAEELLEKVKKEKRVLLTEYESKKLLELYDIPTIETHLCLSEDEAVEAANKIGYPVVLKLNSTTVVHKSDVGGVKLNVQSDKEVKTSYLAIKRSVAEKVGEKGFEGVTVQKMAKLDGFETILGSSLDKQFGPVLLFGSGGVLVEIMKDRSLGLPPLNSTLAKRLMEKTKIYEALKGVRGKKSADLDLLEKILVNFSRLVSEQKLIKECDINPLLVASGGTGGSRVAESIVALDARVLLNVNEPFELAIRPYPSQYVRPIELKNKQKAIVRPIRPEDEPLIVEFYQELSERTVLQRYFQALNYDELIAHERLIRICFDDYDREITLVVELKGSNGAREILGLGKLAKIWGSNEGSFAIIIKDKWQKQGIGNLLLKLIIEVAKSEELDILSAKMLSDNQEMQALCQKLGFVISQEKEFVLAQLKI